MGSQRYFTKLLKHNRVFQIMVFYDYISFER